MQTIDRPVVPSRQTTARHLLSLLWMVVGAALFMALLAVLLWSALLAHV